MKSADLLFTVPASVPFWTARQFEPLIVVIVLPLSYVPSYTGPWLVKGSDKGEHAEQALQRGFKGGEDPNDAGEFHELNGRRERFPPCRNVWCGPCYQEASDDTFPRLDDNEEGLNTFDLEVEQSHPTLSRYRCGRNGDHLMGVQFECDLCSFRNVCGREPAWGDRRDQFTLTSIAGSSWMSCGQGSHTPCPPTGQGRRQITK